MSVDAMTYAKTLRVGPRMKGLLLVIAKNTFNDTGTCKVGQEVLSRETEIPERTLRRYLAELEHLQAIKRRRVGVPGRGGRLHDEIHLTGFLDWLRDHRQIKPAKVAALPPTKPANTWPDQTGQGWPDQTGQGWPDQTGQQVAASYTRTDSRTRPVLSPPTPSFSTSGTQGGREDETHSSSSEGDEPLSRSPIRFSKRWDATARETIERIAIDPATRHVGVLIVAMCGTLHPPADADGTAWARMVVAKLRDYRAEVIKALTEQALGVQGRDVPSISKLTQWVTVIAADHATAQAKADDADRVRAAERAALDRLAPGIEPDAVPQRRDALELRRMFVAHATGGADLDEAWLKDLLVIDRTGGTLRLSVGDRFRARYIGSTQMGWQIVEAAARLWPQIRLVECVPYAHAPRHVQPAGAAA